MCVCVCHWARADATQASQLGALDRETNTALAAVHFLPHTQALAVRDPAHVLPQEQWQGTALGDNSPSHLYEYEETKCGLDPNHLINEFE